MVKVTFCRFVMLCALLLSGCSALDTSEKAVSVLVFAADINYQYESGQFINFIGEVELSESEMVTVIHAIDRVDQAKQGLKHLKENPDEIVTRIEDITFEYVKIKGAYASVRTVVMNHETEYRPMVWEVFEVFDERVQRFDATYIELVEAAESHASLLYAIRLADSVVKIAAVL